MTEDTSKEPEHTAVIKYDGDFNLGGFLQYVDKIGSVGHSFSIVVDPDDKENEKKFGWDGDGADRIWSVEIDGKELTQDASIDSVSAEDIVGNQNRGICHLGVSGPGSSPACGTKNAYMTFGLERFKELPEKIRCTKCQTVINNRRESEERNNKPLPSGVQVPEYEKLRAMKAGELIALGEKLGVPREELYKSTGTPRPWNEVLTAVKRRTRGVRDEEGPTLPKKEAGYKYPAPGPDFCHGCSMFRPAWDGQHDDKCSLVLGSIESEAVCDHFEAQPADTGGTKDAAPADPKAEVIKALNVAYKKDKLGYLRRVKTIHIVPDQEQWNAAYDQQTHEIILEAKFLENPFDEQVQILIHEGGHHGQQIDATTYQAYLDGGLNKIASFVRMANCVHIKDWQKNGIDPVDMTEEVFAESYAHFCLGKEMPEDLLRFWQERAKQ